MQDSSNAELFRFGAANDEFDGFRPIQRTKDGRRQFGWQRGKSSRPIGDEELIFLPLLPFSQPNLGGTARREVRPKGQLLYFYWQRSFYYESLQF